MAKVLKFKDEYVKEVEETKAAFMRRLELLNSKDWIPLNYFNCPNHIFMEGGRVFELVGDFGLKELKMYQNKEASGKTKQFYQLVDGEGKTTRVRLTSLMEELGRFYVTKEELETKEVGDA